MDLKIIIATIGTIGLILAVKKAQEKLAKVPVKSKNKKKDKAS